MSWWGRKVSSLWVGRRFSCLADSRALSTVPVSLNKKRVGTHDGSFHGDDALACFLIRLSPEFKGSDVVRTRDPQLLDMLDAVLDVGGVYDPSRDRYDHHQKGFNEVFGHGFTTKLSASGLVYKHYGMEIIAHQLQLDEGDQNVRRLFIAVYKNFVEAIDAIDNGINQYDTDQPPKYANTTSLSSRIARLNLDWMDHDQTPERENEAFQHAMTLAGSEYLKNVQYHAKSWLPARSIVMEYLSARWITDPSGEIMTLYTFCPTIDACKVLILLLQAHFPLKLKEWKLHLFELEEEMKIDPPIKYVLYQDDRNKRWRVQAVAVSPDKFESRKALPSPWRGLNDDELSKEAGIPGCVFVHASGFIGGNHSYHGALAMARTALQF